MEPRLTKYRFIIYKEEVQLAVHIVRPYIDPEAAHT